MIIKEDVYITPFDDMRTLHIYLPDDLGEDERLETIYMFDGHNLYNDEDATFGTSWRIADTFKRYNVRAIVIGLECNHEGNLRLFEFSPYDFYDNDYGEIEGHGKELFEWLVYELKPYIDSKYPTIPFREYTTIGGSSMGGLMALYGAVAHSDIYSKALVISPHIFYMMDDILNDIYHSDINRDTTIYFSIGADESKSKRGLASYVDYTFRLQRALDSKVNLLLNIFKYDDHSERAWAREVKVWLRQLHYI